MIILNYELISITSLQPKGHTTRQQPEWINDRFGEIIVIAMLLSDI